MAIRASDTVKVCFLNEILKIIGCYFKPMISLSDYYKMKLEWMFLLLDLVDKVS